MKASEAAAALLKQLHAPVGMVTILPRLDSGKTLLEVLIDDRASSYKDRVPQVFEGFRTRIKKRTPFSAFLH